MVVHLLRVGTGCKTRMYETSLRVKSAAGDIHHVWPESKNVCVLPNCDNSDIYTEGPFTVLIQEKKLSVSGSPYMALRLTSGSCLRTPFIKIAAGCMSSELCGAMAAQSQPFTGFHKVHGTNIRIDPTGTQATRVESFANGICFSQDPLAPGQLFLVEIEEKELGWCGHLRVGLIARDPRSLDTVPEYSLPDLVNQGDSWIFAITRNHNRVVPDEEENAPSWGRDLAEPYLKVGKFKIPRDKLIARSRPSRFSHILDDLYKTNILPPTALRSRIGVLYEPQADGTCHMHMVINGEDMGASARGIPATHPLYAVIDVFASTKSVRVIQLEYGFPSLQTLCRLVIQKHVVHRLAIDWLDLPQLLKNFCKYE